MNTDNPSTEVEEEREVPRALVAIPPQRKVHYDMVSVMLHWLIALLITVQLITGWYVSHIPQTASIRESLFNFHLALGLAGLGMLIFFMLWRVFHSAPDLPQAIPPAQRLLIRAVDVLLFIFMLLTALSGYLVSVTNDSPLDLWGIPLPTWQGIDGGLVALFDRVHVGAAPILAVLIIVHILIVALYNRKHPGMMASMSASLHHEGGAVTAEHVRLASKESRGLARNFRIVGWLAFWGQLILWLVGALLLTITASGNYSAAGEALAAPGVFWARLAVVVLMLSILAFFYCTRLAQKISLTPDLLLNRHRMIRAPGLVAFIGFVGMSLGIIGLASSVGLLITKTISQPPGIAITDPSKIIRALDVFILLANFDMVVAHFLGALAALWLTNRALHYCKA